MGLLCSMLACSSCCCRATHVATSPPPPPPPPLQSYKVLLLGATGSGKTELGLLLSGQLRAIADHEATNGVRYYHSTTAPLGMGAAKLVLTEVGGNVDMQRLWPHYYATTHSLIYCFDLRACYAALQAAMALLQRCLMHESLQGKPVLLVATRQCDGVQLYDVEHAFALAGLANRSGCPLHICQFDGAGAIGNASLWQGIDWLRRQLQLMALTLTQRIKYDVNKQSWQRRKRALLSSGKLAQVRRQRFRRQHRKLWPLKEPVAARPATAPATVFYIRTVEPTTVT